MKLDKYLTEGSEKVKATNMLSKTRIFNKEVSDFSTDILLMLKNPDENYKKLPEIMWELNIQLVNFRNKLAEIIKRAE